MKLSGAYSQELFRDRAGQTSATVRFPIPCAYDGVAPEGAKPGYWERLIDRPRRFGKRKANMPGGWSYRGHVWHHPSVTMQQLAGAEQIWIAEGIFDAAALQLAFDRDGLPWAAVSTLSTNNWPEHFLAALRVAAKAADAALPTIVFAFDVGAAGVTFARKYVERATEEGWTARAAQVRPDGEGDKRDWNDLWIADELSGDMLQAALENGDITTAESAKTKAYLLWKRSNRPTFDFTFGGRTFWASVSADQANAKIEEWAKNGDHEDLDPHAKLELAARETISVSEIANCTFRALYFQRAEEIDQSSYYFRVDFPGRQASVKAEFSGNSVAGAGDFKKRIISVAPGAIFSGITPQLDRIMGRQMNGIQTVDALYFSGYSRDHGAWMFDELAVKDGRAVPINDDDYFDIGKVGVKPHVKSGEFVLPSPDADVDYGWWDDFQLAFGPRGTVVLAFFFMALFAEQIRAMHQSVGFLELSGEPGTGKSTLIMFLWKLMGRRNGYEGFDPSTATAAAIARELVKFGNLPTVMLEGDRRADSHAKKFDWNELKKLYNGHSPRARGVANAGVTTFDPPFRGALLIEQNQPIREADQAVLERIMGLTFTKKGHTPEGQAAARRIENAGRDDIGGWMLAMIRQEKTILETFAARHAHWEGVYKVRPDVQNTRLAHNHAQLAAALDAMADAMRSGDRPVIAQSERAAAQELIERMCVERHTAVGADHPVIAHFWDIFDEIERHYLDKTEATNFHRKHDLYIAVHLPTIERRAYELRLQLPVPMVELKKYLPLSKSRKFIGTKDVNCVDDKGRHCWVFTKPAAAEPTRRAA